MKEYNSRMIEREVMCTKYERKWDRAFFPDSVRPTALLETQQVINGILTTSKNIFVELVNDSRWIRQARVNALVVGGKTFPEGISYESWIDKYNNLYHRHLEVYPRLNMDQVDSARRDSVLRKLLSRLPKLLMTTDDLMILFEGEKMVFSSDGEGEIIFGPVASEAPNLNDGFHTDNPTFSYSMKDFGRGTNLEAFVETTFGVYDANDVPHDLFVGGKKLGEEDVRKIVDLSVTIKQYV